MIDPMAANGSDAVLARARAMTPTDPGVRACWQFVVRGIEAGWLDDDSLAEVVQALADGTDRGYEELAFDHLGDELRVSFLDDERAARPPRCVPS